LVVGVGLASISTFGGMLWCFFVVVAGVCVTVVGLVRSSFLGPRVSGLLLQFIRVPLHVVVVLLCLVFRAS